MPRMDIILASVSPRRRELLRLIFEKFRVVPSEFDESNVPSEMGPTEHVVYSSLMKARDVAEKHPESLVIAADTVVVVDRTILGKPSDAEDAVRVLRLLGGRVHKVYTGVSVAANGTERSGFECTEVAFRELDDDIIARYIATGEPMDKAGAYAIQGKGSVLIKSISGCYFNVVGLPIYLLSNLLEEFNIRPLEDC